MLIFYSLRLKIKINNSSYNGSSTHEACVKHTNIQKNTTKKQNRNQSLFDCGCSREFIKDFYLFLDEFYVLVVDAKDVGALA